MTLDRAGDNAGVVWKTNWIEGIELDPVGIKVANILNPIYELSNYPNPFNPATTISFSVAKTASFVSVGIYNLKGQKVKQLISSQLSSGQYTIVWDGTDQTNKPVSSGVYFYKLKTGRIEQTKKMMLLK